VRQVGRVGDGLHLRTLFAAEPGNELEVRRRIHEALAGGELRGAGEAATTRWQLQSSRSSRVREEEWDHAQRLIDA